MAVSTPEEGDARQVGIDADPAIQNDGVWWFNRVYLWSRQNVIAEAARGVIFEDPAYIRRLDVAFVNWWLNAYDLSQTNPSKLPLCWQPLFQQRRNTHILPVQFILAGLTAHIFRDLTLAVFQTEKWINVFRNKKFSSAHWRDYERVNQILDRTMRDQVLPVVRDSYHGELLLGIDALLAGFSISGARLDAWDRGNTMRLLYPFIGGGAGSAQDLVYSAEAGILAKTFLAPPLADLL